MCTRWSNPTGMPSTTGITCPATGSTSTRNNPNHILPDITFMPAAGGANALPNTRNINIGQGQNFPWLASNDTHNFSVNLTHLRGSHNLKTGFFYERTGRPGPLSSNAGTYNFNSDAANPLDTNFGWANAMLGHLNTYTEGNNNTRSLPRFNQPEFFFQDNWRMTRRLTLDLGVRFSHVGVVYEKDREIGWFDPAAWDPARAVQLWQPHCANGVFPCTGANRVARNPITGEQRPSPWIGAVVQGSGDINNGTVFGREIPDTFPSAGIRTAPRLGFGWDVFGDGKTAVRGGFGTSYNRLGDGQYGGFTGVISRTVNLQWTTIDDRFNAPSLENPLGGTAVQEETQAHHRTLLECRRTARAAVAPAGRCRLCGQYGAQRVGGQRRPVLHQSAQRPGSTAGRQTDAGHDRSDDRQRAADQLHSSQLSRSRRHHPARIPG